jgi:hypothetical protein
MKLKTIVVVGTSFSSAGGFEPDSQVRKVLPKYMTCRFLKKWKIVHGLHIFKNWYLILKFII